MRVPSTRRRFLTLATSVIALGLFTVGCGDGSKENGDGTGGSGAGGGGTGGGNDGPLEFVDITVPAGPFRYGINLGHRNLDWGDPEHAKLAVAAGASSMRVSLPERHLAEWGYDIELGDMEAYDGLGMGPRVAFLTEPIAEHSLAPAGTAAWKLAFYPPRNLYEPILRDDGTINPENYWAAYVYETVSRYSPWIGVWEIWNEPDWVSDGSFTQTWGTEPPTAVQLPHWNGSIYEYVRLLRVSAVAAKAADPDARIATGGLGYETFLAALLRYTDNPTDGAVNDDYPATGAAFFDVLSFHHYPLYTSGNSDAAVDAYLEHRQAFADTLAAAGKVVAGWENTETGAPHAVIPGTSSGEEYARNYLVKVLTQAQAAGIDGVDWYVLSDYGAAVPTARDDGYEWMGLYDDIAELGTTAQAAATPTGVAYATLGGLLRGAIYDATATTSLGLTDPVRGAAFALDDGRAAYVLWARGDADTELGSATHELATAVPLTAYAWDASVSGTTTSVVPTAGAVTLDLTSSPTILLEE